MKQVKPNQIEILATMEEFADAHSFIGDQLKRNSITKQIIQETMLVFEALYHNLLDQGFGEETILSIKVQKTIGELTIKIGFEGKPFREIGGDPGVYSPEDEIIKAYEDKTDFSYRSGYNLIRLVVKRNYHLSMIFCAAGFLLAILVYLPFHFAVNPISQSLFVANVLNPLLRLFANAMLMIGTPVTFFSLLKNLTDTYVVAERNYVGRKLQLKTLATSIITVLLAIGISLLIAALLGNLNGYLVGIGEVDAAPSFADIIRSLLPDNIVQPFETFMPFPIIIIALLITFAFCSVGKYFDIMKTGIDAFYTLFAKMLNIVIFALPFFFFLTVLSSLFAGGFHELLIIFELVIAGTVSLIAVAVFYLIRLLVGGVKIRPFLKHLRPLIRENFKIASAIEATPFNIRYCVRNYGMDRKRITEKLPILAQINLDGNSFLIMAGSMGLVMLFGGGASWFHILVIAILVVFLSFGAPNQPGSILIGMMIISLYLHADTLASFAIYAEVFFGSAQNIINVTGDIVTIAIEEHKIKKQLQE